MLHRSSCSTSSLPKPAPVSAGPRPDMSGPLPARVRDTLRSRDFFLPLPTASTNSFVFRSFHTLLTIQRRMVILRYAVTKDPPALTAHYLPAKSFGMCSYENIRVWHGFLPISVHPACPEPRRERLSRRELDTRLSGGQFSRPGAVAASGQIPSWSALRAE